MTPILILHGWGSSGRKWLQIKNLLETQELKVFTPDLPGFGETPPPQSAWSVDDYVEWVREFCEGKGLSQFFLLGHSFGGAIATKFTLKYPEKVKKLFLAAPAIIRRKSAQKDSIKKVASLFSFLPIFIKKILYKIFFKSDYFLTVGIMRETYLKVIQEDLLSFLPEIKVSTIVIWGDQDRVTPFGDSSFVAGSIPGAKLKTIFGVGHNLRKEAPDQLVKIILEELQ